MAERYMSEMLSAAVLAAESTYYGRAAVRPVNAEVDALGEAEGELISRSDSFFLATVNAEGWPYLQHRGGPAGFLKVLDPHTLAFADLRGNRQLITTGNLAGNDRASLLIVDYPRRERLKILGHARALDARDHAELADRLSPSPALRRRVERLMLIDVVGFDWNCPAYITPRYTAAELREALGGSAADGGGRHRGDAGGPGPAADGPG